MTGHFLLTYLFIFVIIVLGYVVTFIKVPNMSYTKYVIVEFAPSIILLYPPSLIPGIVSTGLIFPFSYVSA
jgi:hypothetical protein